MAVESSGEFERAFRGAVQYALDTGFTEILELKHVQEEARCVCGAADWKREIFNLPTRDWSRF